MCLNLHYQRQPASFLMHSELVIVPDLFSLTHEMCYSVKLVSEIKKEIYQKDTLS